jgi:TPR repeat protein
VKNYSLAFIVCQSLLKYLQILTDIIDSLIFKLITSCSIETKNQEHIMSLRASNLYLLTIFIVTVLAIILFLKQPEVLANQSKKSIEDIQKQAKLGNVDSQFLLGYLYNEGESVPKNLKKALKWYKKAAEQGHAEAQFNLGRLYDLGEGVSQNDKEAVKWYRKAAEQGELSGQFSLGAMYFTGDGVPQDYEEAAKWFLKAAEQEDADAQFLLAGMYYAGQGVLQDYVKAYAWFNLAAANGNADAADYLDRLGKIMTKQQIVNGQELSKKLVNVEESPKEYSKSDYETQSQRIRKN